MKTALPDSINTVEEAKKFLTDLYNNGEAYHPEDSAILIDIFTQQEGEQLNKLMSHIYNLDGNNGNHATPKFDPCKFLLDLDGHIIE